MSQTTGFFFILCTIIDGFTSYSAQKCSIVLWCAENWYIYFVQSLNVWRCVNHQRSYVHLSIKVIQLRQLLKDPLSTVFRWSQRQTRTSTNMGGPVELQTLRYQKEQEGSADTTPRICAWNNTGVSTAMILLYACLQSIAQLIINFFGPTDFSCTIFYSIITVSRFTVHMLGVLWLWDRG